MLERFGFESEAFHIGPEGFSDLFGIDSVFVWRITMDSVFILRIVRDEGFHAICGFAGHGQVKGVVDLFDDGELIGDEVLEIHVVELSLRELFLGSNRDGVFEDALDTRRPILGDLERVDIIATHGTHECC